MRSRTDIALVTGAARGLGTEIARALAGQKMRVVLADIDAEAVEAAAREIDPSGERAFGISLDIRSVQSIVQARVQIERRWSAVSALVNNAAVTPMTGLWDITAEEFDAVVTTNLRGTFLMSREFAGPMRAQAYGRIVNLGSLAGQSGGSGTGAHYAASKAGIGVLTKIFARELQSAGIAVNCVAPGPLDGPLARAAAPELFEKVKRAIPVGHLGDMSSIAAIIAWLASPDADFVSGACWDMNGGLSMR
ncbi:SDR family oxidoreductase [Sphingobium sp. AS12]|uniref:SDR family NAD(P)-dependent oxidoreductase n=1 Tax=Sphingobium sp. AS12 TaxID=2849495 RepID=UPI001C318F20|nr:SDR family oxidoreductase [Sphingobium sp. AS12]MBV2149810.1 SDR family oxidoreductase [Sphingobium sp. AS12]